MALAKACAELRTGTARNLYLRSKRFGDDGARALAVELEQNRSLTNLNLDVRL